MKRSSRRRFQTSVVQRRLFCFLVCCCLLERQQCDGAAASGQALPSSSTSDFPHIRPPPSSPRYHHQSTNNDKSNSHNNNKTSNPPKLGLYFAGRIKCLLWGSSSLSSSSSTTTTTASSEDYSPQQQRRRRQQQRQLTSLFGTTTATTTTATNNPRKNKRWIRIPQWTRPSSIYALADYHFHKDCIMGIQKVGMMFCWKFNNSRHRRQNGSDGSNSNNSISKFFQPHLSLPTTLDVTTEQSVVPSSSVSSSSSSGTSLRLGWDRSNDYDNRDDNDAATTTSPWFQVRIHHPQQQDEKEQQQSIINGSFGFFVPIFQRLGIQYYLSSFDKLHNTKRDTAPSFPTSSLSSGGDLKDFASRGNNRNKNDDDFNTVMNKEDWWIPQITLDPFGVLSSENQYYYDHSTANRSRQRQQPIHFPLLEFKLRVRMKAPSILFLPGGGGMGSSTSYEDDMQYQHPAMIRLDCTAIHDDHQQMMAMTMKNPHESSSRKTTISFQTGVLPSTELWWLSIKDTARLDITHEQIVGYEY